MYANLDEMELTSYKAKQHRKELAKVWQELETVQTKNNSQSEETNYDN